MAGRKAGKRKPSAGTMSRPSKVSTRSVKKPYRSAVTGRYVSSDVVRAPAARVLRPSSPKPPRGAPDRFDAADLTLDDAAGRRLSSILGID